MLVTEIFERMHDSSRVVYHGSDEKFASFDPDRVKSASGADKGGWGFYFSTSPDVAADYASMSGEVRKYRIPSGPYFDLDAGLENRFGEELIDELERRDIDADEIKEFRSDFLSSMYIDVTSNKQVYDWLSVVVGSPRDASEVLSAMGYAGNTFRDKTDPDARNFVVFDPKDIRSV